MALRTDKNRPWKRKLDGDLHNASEQPFERAYPVDSDEVAAAVKRAETTEGTPREARACGSHWGISECAVTKGTMIETATPVHELDGDQGAGRLNDALRNIIPDCLTDEAWRFFMTQAVPPFNPYASPSHAELYLFHVESGMRIHELYWLMDSDREKIDGASLAAQLKAKGAVGDYSGPWACETLGGAGGQTIVGAMSTGTHGGDVNFGPIASMAVALHLVDAQGTHHWIERTRLRPTMLPIHLVDGTLVRQRFGMEYHRDDDLFNAVVVSCGRMGAICSVVLRAVRQYALEEEVNETDWNDVRTWINNKSPVFLINRFVSVEINPNGQWKHPSQHTCYVRTRRLRALNDAGSPPYGRDERGVKHGTEVNLTTSAGGLSAILCGTDDILRAPFKDLVDYFEKAREKAVAVWVASAAIIVAPLPIPPSVRQAALAAQSAAAGVIAYTTIMLDIVWRIIDHILPPPPTTFSDATALALNYLSYLSHIADTLSLHSADLFFIIRMVIGGVFASEAGGKLQKPAISYAVMDGHNYKNKGCVAPGDSIEVFFDANDPNVQVFIEKMFHRVHQLEMGEVTDDGHPAVFGGYISARFMAASDAFLAMQRWPMTCALEIAGLSRVNGTQKFLELVEADAIETNAIIHWGQRNNWHMKQVESLYDPSPPMGLLYRWREALSSLTDHGRFDLFSTKFSHQRGLEITVPRIKSLACAPEVVCAGSVTVVEWDAISNPPETVAELKIWRADGTTETRILPSLIGSLPLPAPIGISKLELLLARELNGQVYHDSRTTQCHGVLDGDERPYLFTAELYNENGQDFWAYFHTLRSRFISNSLLVSEIEVTFTGPQIWTLQTPGLPVLAIPTSPTRLQFPTRPVFNKEWNYRANPPHAPGAPPQIGVRYKLVCQH